MQIITSHIPNPIRKQVIQLQFSPSRVQPNPKNHVPPLETSHPLHSSGRPPSPRRTNPPNTNNKHRLYNRIRWSPSKGIEGQDIYDTTGKTRPTNELVTVKTILGPLTLEDVPIIRCVGLNYAKHGNYTIPVYGWVFGLLVAYRWLRAIIRYCGIDLGGLYN